MDDVGNRGLLLIVQELQSESTSSQSVCVCVCVSHSRNSHRSHFESRRSRHRQRQIRKQTNEHAGNREKDNEAGAEENTLQIRTKTTKQNKKQQKRLERCTKRAHEVKASTHCRNGLNDWGISAFASHATLNYVWESFFSFCAFSFFLRFFHTSFRQVDMQADGLTRMQDCGVLCCTDVACACAYVRMCAYM